MHSENREKASRARTHLFIQYILSAHPLPLTSGLQGHGGNPDDSIPISIALSLIRKMDGSHAVANINKCYQGNKIR